MLAEHVAGPTPDELDELEKTVPYEEDEFDGDDIEEEDPEGDFAEQAEATAAVAATPAWSDPLEDLYTEAQLARAAKPTRRHTNPSIKHALDSAAKRLHNAYTDSENWTRKRGVALYHKESGTLLGVFSEYLHRDGSSIKRLREKSLISIDGQLEVEGTWWLEPQAREHIEAAKRWQEQRHEIIPLHLDRLGLFCPAAPITIFFQFGGIMRVELTEECQFASTDGATLMTLAKGVNVYEVMELEGKVALRKEITL